MESETMLLRHSNISKELTLEGAVLLENNGILPISKQGTVALFGYGAFHTRASAGGGPGGGPGGPGGGPGEAGGAPNRPGSPGRVDTSGGPEGGPNGPVDGPGDGIGPGMRSPGRTLPGFHTNISEALTAAGYRILTDESGSLPAEKPDYVIYVLRRDSAEGSDRTATPGDYYLTVDETTTLTDLARLYGNVILTLNCCAATDFYSVCQAINREVENGIGAVISCGLGGEGMGDAVVSLLNGTANPSGKLTDTWALRYEDYPSAKTFGEAGHTNFTNDGDNEYFFEGIYNGYRYFDTFHIPVAYPFGFGRSYTSFETRVEKIVFGHDGVVTVAVCVKNTGEYSGKEVVQLYGSYCYEAGKSRLETPYQTLAGFQKTGQLAPGESEVMEVRFPVARMASFDEETDCFMLQAGDYLLRMGNSSRSTGVIAVLVLQETAITEQCTPGLFEIRNDPRTPGDDVEILRSGSLSYKDITLPMLDFQTWEAEGVPRIALHTEAIRKVSSISEMDDSTVITYVSEDGGFDSNRWAARNTPDWTEKNEIYELVRTYPDATLLDVSEGRLTMEQFLAGLSNEELADIVTGSSSEQTKALLDETSPLIGAVPQNVSGYQSTQNLLTKRLIPQIFQADGPESPGITLTNDEIWAGKTDNSVVTDSYSAVVLPSGTVMAQSWNPVLLTQMGKAVGEEMLSAGLSIWLAPGANIHRNPLGGRNYQYYSEDPLITGVMLTAEVRGVQSQGGVFCCVKHFAANGMETNRGEINEVISERALREIYLPGWRMCAQSEDPNGSFMSAYNQINGVYCGESYDLLMHLIRGEWHWDGMVMDDYTPWFFLCWRDLTVCPQMGNDLVMPGNTANNVMPVPFVPMENPVTKLEYEGVTAPFQSDSYLMLAALRDGRLLLGDLQRSAAAVLKLYMKTDVFQKLRAAIRDGIK